MSRPPPFHRGDLLRLGSTAGPGEATIVLARREGGWDLLGEGGTIGACTDGEVAAARAAGRLTHVPAGLAGGTTSRPRASAAARVEAERRLCFVERVDRLCAGPKPSVAACQRAAREVHAEVAASTGEAPSASAVRRWHHRWSQGGRDPLALLPQTHLRGNRTPRHGRAEDGLPDAYELIEDARPTGRGRGAVSRAYRSYARGCCDLGIAPVGEATFRRAASRAPAPVPAADPAGPARGDEPVAMAAPDPVVRHPELLRTWRALDAHADRDPGGAGVPLLVVTGRRGTGVRTAVRRWAEDRGAAGPDAGILMLDAPHPAAKHGISAAILRAFGTRPGPAPRLRRAVEAVARQVGATSTRLIVVGEGHRLAADGIAAASARLDELSALLDGAGARFVLAGGPALGDVAAALGTDRARVHALCPYDLAAAAPGGPFSELARGLAATAGLAWPPASDAAWDERLCAATAGSVARTGRYLRHAATLAAERGLTHADAALMSEVDGLEVSTPVGPGPAPAPGGACPFRCAERDLAVLWARRTNLADLPGDPGRRGCTAERRGKE